jgi:hypothetical protein
MIICKQPTHMPQAALLYINLLLELVRLNQNTWLCEMELPSDVDTRAVFPTGQAGL